MSQTTSLVRLRCCPLVVARLDVLLSLTVDLEASHYRFSPPSPPPPHTHRGGSNRELLWC